MSTGGMSAGAFAGKSRRPGRLGIGLIGAGKVGTVLAAALRAADHAVVGVHAVSQDSAARAEALLPDVPLLDIPELLRRSEAVILAVPATVLPELVSGLAASGHWKAGQLVVHTAARFGVDVLTPAREAGAIPLAVHPAMEFTGTSMDLRRLDGASFAVTSDPLMLPVAQALVVEMGAEPVVIEEEDRALYAAALELAADPLGTVAATAWEGLRAAGVQDPSRLMGPLLRSGVENALMAGLAAGQRAASTRTPEAVAATVQALASAKSLGAGVAASDSATGALGAEGMPAVDVYASLVRAATARALARGVIDGDTAAAVLDALDS
ncbi:MAG: Rossmann-like and DUF2520 domain-containing protein [Galactobacter sp.]